MTFDDKQAAGERVHADLLLKMALVMQAGGEVTILASEIAALHGKCLQTKTADNPDRTIIRVVDSQPILDRAGLS